MTTVKSAVNMTSNINNASQNYMDSMTSVSYGEAITRVKTLIN